MSQSTQPQKPITKGQIEALNIFKAHADDAKNEHREGWLIADQSGVNLLTIRALETRGFLEPAYKGRDWSTLPYKITEAGRRACADPEVAVDLSPDMDKALKTIFWRDEEWIYPWLVQVHENTLRSLVKRGFLETDGSRDPSYKISERGKDYVRVREGQKS